MVNEDLSQLWASYLQLELSHKPHISLPRYTKMITSHIHHSDYLPHVTTWITDLCLNFNSVRNRTSNPEGVSPRDLTYCSHKPECIATTNRDRSVLITIITWHFQFRPVNVSILHLKDDYHARSESRFACYAHCYVTWCPLTTGIVASQCPSARDAVLVTR